MSNSTPKPKRRYKRYSSEFKREALLRASEEGMTDKAVCDELGICTRQFKRWRDELALDSCQRRRSEERILFGDW
jgi:transposase-like protein